MGYSTEVWCGLLGGLLLVMLRYRNVVDSGQLPVVSRQRQSRAARRASELGPSQIELDELRLSPSSRPSLRPSLLGQLLNIPSMDDV